MAKCKHCEKFFARFQCNKRVGECDCPKCQGYCSCVQEGYEYPTEHADRVWGPVWDEVMKRYGK